MQNTAINSRSGLLAASSSLLGYSAGTTSNGIQGISTPTICWPIVDTPVIDYSYRSDSSMAVASFNIKSTQNMQAKLVVFKVKRDEKGNVISSEFVKEFWVEKLPNVSIELLAVKELDPGFDPKDIIIKELLTVYF